MTVENSNASCLVNGSTVKTLGVQDFEGLANRVAIDSSLTAMGQLVQPSGLVTDRSLSLPLNGSIGAGTFTRTTNAWNPETGQVGPHNLFTYSNDFSNAAWTKTSNGGAAVPSRNGSLQPDYLGGVTASQFTIGATTAAEFSVVEQAFTAVALTYYTVLWVKCIAADIGKVLDVYQWTGTVAGDFKSITLTGQWQQITTTFAHSAGAGKTLSLGNNGVRNGGIARPSCTIDVCFAQLNQYSLTSYVPTTAAAVYAPRYVSGGILVEEASTNVFLNSQGTAAVTQNIAVTTAGSGKWTCSVFGAGTVTSSANTATATGYGAATPGSPNTITVTGNGNVTYTVTGATAATIVNVENLPYATSPIVTYGAATTRAAETLTHPTSGYLTAAQGTVACWVYVNTAMQADSNVRTMFEHISSGALDMISFYKGISNSYGLYMTNHVGSVSNPTASATLSTGWHNLAITWNSSEQAIWIDGVKQGGSGTVAGSNVPSVLASTFNISGKVNNTSILDQTIDSLMIYNRPLTAAEITQLYRSGRK